MLYLPASLSTGCKAPTSLCKNVFHIFRNDDGDDDDIFRSMYQINITFHKLPTTTTLCLVYNNSKLADDRHLQYYDTGMKFWDP